MLWCTVKANMEASEEDKLPEEEIQVDQMSCVLPLAYLPRAFYSSCSIFSTLAFAAMDTTSNTLSLTLWRLAKNPAAQDRLRKKVLDAQAAHGGGDIGYDDLVVLPYMDAVCRETLRW